MGSPEAHILIADDDASVRETLREAFVALGCHVETRADGAQALAALREDAWDVAFVDYQMPQADGIQVLREAAAIAPETAVVLITGEGSEQVARDAFKLGAFDYVAKPFRRLSDLEIILTQARESQRLKRENTSLRRENRSLKSLIEKRYSFEGIVGDTPEMRAIFDLIDRVAATRSTVLITGESGTGKELIARSLHCRGDRKSGPFVTVNCGALSDSLLEDELFGHVKGAFTDAIGDRMGRFELAQQGTLFLDEIGTMSQNLQVKLLRVLQEREITPLGGTRRIPVDVRIIAATNTDLRLMMEEGRLRKDLFYRLNVIHIELPPLSRRQADIPLLAGHFLDRLGRDAGRPAPAFTPAAMRLLMGYPWPGNIRQLENVVERGVALCADRPLLDVDALPAEIRGGGAEPDARDGLARAAMTQEGLYLDAAVSDFEGRLVLQALHSSGWVKTRAARLLHIKRTTLIEKMKRLGIPLDPSRDRQAS